MEYLTVKDIFDFIFFDAIVNDWRWWQWVAFLTFGNWVTLKGMWESD